MRRPPGSTISHHRVEDDQQLPHARYQSHLLGLAGGQKALVELPYGGIEARSDQGSHVERLSDPRPGAPHRTSASQSARVAVEGSDTYEGRELLGRKGAEFGQLRKERPAKHRTYSGNAPEESLVRLDEGGALFDGLIEVPVGASELFFEPPYVRFDASAHGLEAARPEAVFLSAQHAHELPSSCEDLPKLPGFLVWDGSGRGTDGLCEAGKNESIQSVGFGQLAGGFGEVPRLAGVDYEEGYSRGGQGRDDGTLEASRGLQEHQSLRELGELADELLDAGLVVGSGEAFLGGEDSNIQGSLADVYPHVAGSSSGGAQSESPFPPAVPILAGTSSGSSFPAQATVRAPPPAGALEGRGDPGFPAVSKRSSGPRRYRSTAPTPTDCRQEPKHKVVVLSRRVISSPRLPAPMRGGAFSSGVEAPAGRTIYVSGQVSMDADGNVVGEGDIKRQTETVLEHVKTVVEEAGGGMDDIVKVTVFISDMRLYDEIHEVRRSYFGEPYPASSMVEVSALIDPRLLIEIEAVAVIE